MLLLPNESERRARSAYCVSLRCAELYVLRDEERYLRASQSAYARAEFMYALVRYPAARQRLRTLRDDARALHA